MRSSSILPQVLIQNIHFIALLVAAILLFAYLAGIHRENAQWLDGNNRVLGGDFINSWMMGKLAHTEKAPAENYRIEIYGAKLRVALGLPSYPWQQWSYPPTYALAMLPFAALPYLLALGAMIAGSMLALRNALRGTALFATALASPASLFSLVSGQLALVFTTLQLAAFRWLDKKQIAAGICIGLLCLKPQLGLVYPFFLIATRRWRVFGYAMLTVLTITALSLAVLGSEMWVSYWQYGLPNQVKYVLSDTPDIIQALMPTLYMDLKAMEVGHTIALTIQLLVAGAGLLLLFTPWFYKINTSTQQLTVATLGILITPYLMPYDTLFFTVCLLLYLREQNELLRWEATLIIGSYGLAMLHFIAAIFHVPGTALLPLVLLYLLWRRSDSEVVDS